MRSLATCSLTAAVLLYLLPALGLAEQQSEIPAECHPWGRFPVGAWKQVRVVTETFDEAGKVAGISKSDIITTLREVNISGVVLDVDVVVEVGGKRLAAPPQVVRQGFHGEPTDQPVQITNLGTGEVVIDGQKTACRIEQVEITGCTTKTTTKIYWTASVAPFVLKRHTVTRDVDGENVLSQKTVDVVVLDTVCQVLDVVKKASHVKTVLVHPRGETTTDSVVVVDVPGGVVCHTAKEVDEQGRLVSRSTLELVEYGLQPRQDHGGLLRRFRDRLPLHRLFRDD